MRRLLAIPLVILVASCLHARSDARIKRGGQIGVASSVMWTPDAETNNGDDFDAPQFEPAADFRGYNEVWAAYGWKRAELRWHYPFLRWSSRNDFPSYDESRFEPGIPVVGWLELYVQAVRSGPWFAGFGVETSRSAYVIATYVIATEDAISATARGTYLGKDGDTRSAQLQAQLAYTRTLDPKHDLNVFVSGIWTAGDPGTIRVIENKYLSTGSYARVDAGSIGILGASIDWH